MRFNILIATLMFVYLFLVRPLEYLLSNSNRGKTHYALKKYFYLYRFCRLYFMLMNLHCPHFQCCIFLYRFIIHFHFTSVACLDSFKSSMFVFASSNSRYLLIIRNMTFSSCICINICKLLVVYCFCLWNLW